MTDDAIEILAAVTVAECLGAAAAAGSSRWGGRLSSMGRCPWHGNPCDFDGVEKLTEDVDYSRSNPKLP